MEFESTVSFPKYTEEKEKCLNFIQNFIHHSEIVPSRKYLDILQAVANREQTVIEIELDDVLSFQGDEAFVEKIAKNSQRYIQLFSQIFDELMPVPSQNVNDVEDIWDILRNQRLAQIHSSNPEMAEGLNQNNNLAGFPPSLMRRYEARLIPSSDMKAISLRNVKAEHIGCLARIKGMVTRVSDVKPLMEVATYTCDNCGFEVYQEIFSRGFTPLSECPSEVCTANQQKGKLFLQTRGSKFERYQELKIQELPDQVPIGHIPRTMTVQCRGSTTRLVSPGDMITVGGIFLPQRYAGYRALKAGLIADTFLLAQSIFKHKKTYSEHEIDLEVLEEAQESGDIYTRLARSIAPEIYGHEDVKKALLLMLVGGATRKLPDGMRIRGDINILLMGDPGVAKSQLLKYISTVAPRGVYTTGKGSSGVGLTAAVAKDPVTGDHVLEGGALVLADRGICCIDEFDKMEESDRTAIHEVMEQQTVSIAKAGITATLNARTAVLAAANPLMGRYNKKLPMSQNINLPNSLLSRFDLVFVLIDRADPDLDIGLARHVAFVHRYHKNPNLDFEPFDQHFIKSYIAQARKFKPYVPKEQVEYIVAAYVDMRQNDARAPSDQTAMTARQLLSILRLAQALARLRFSDVIQREEIDEAMRLTEASKSSLCEDEVHRQTDVQSRIFRMILGHKQATQKNVISYTVIEAQALRMGFTPEQIEHCLHDYSELQILHVDEQRTMITILA